MTGTIRTLRADKGFGFIKDTAGNDYFFHQSAIYGEGIADLPCFRPRAFPGDARARLEVVARPIAPRESHQFQGLQLVVDFLEAPARPVPPALLDGKVERVYRVHYAI